MNSEWFHFAHFSMVSLDAHIQKRRLTTVPLPLSKKDDDANNKPTAKPEVGN